MIKRIIIKLIIFLRRKFIDEDKLVSWAIKSPFRSSFYYFLFNRNFGREHQSVLYGKYIHLKGKNKGSGLDATLRRNIHRLEKGLIMSNPRNTFAESYITETVDAYAKFSANAHDSATIKWATDVLNQYFKSVDHCGKIVKAFEIYKDVRKNIEFQDAETPFIPYQRTNGTKSNVSYEEFYQLTRQRRSVRWYKNEKPPLELIEKAISAALQSPSACNRQPFRFHIINERVKLNELINLPMGADTFAHNIPMIAILIGDLSAYFDERDRHLIYIDGGLAVMSLILALETLGLSSCTINWPDIELREKKLSQSLNLTPYERCIMFISIGYALPEGKIPYSQKKMVREILLYNQ